MDLDLNDHGGNVCSFYFNFVLVQNKIYAKLLFQPRTELMNLCVWICLFVLGLGISVWYVQSTAYQTIHFELCNALTTKALALISNCKSEINNSKNKIWLLYDFLLTSYKKKFFFGIFYFWIRHMIYMHLLTWISFGLLGYVPNTLYRVSATCRGRRCFIFMVSLYIKYNY
jgi:hypothetical protein